MMKGELNLFKRLIVCFLSFFVGFIVSVYTPISLLIAFNLTKAPGYYNPEGEIFRPVGWILFALLLLLLIMTVLIGTKIIKLNLLKNVSSSIFILCLFLGGIIGIIYQHNAILLLIKCFLTS